MIKTSVWLLKVVVSILITVVLLGLASALLVEFIIHISTVIVEAVVVGPEVVLGHLLIVHRLLERG